MGCGSSNTYLLKYSFEMMGMSSSVPKIIYVKFSIDDEVEIQENLAGFLLKKRKFKLEQTSMDQIINSANSMTQGVTAFLLKKTDAGSTIGARITYGDSRIFAKTQYVKPRGSKQPRNNLRNNGDTWEEQICLKVDDSGYAINYIKPNHFEQEELNKFYSLLE
eukprot:73837_1